MQVPVARWEVHAQSALSEPIASRVRHAGFVQGAEFADNAIFAVSPAEAAAMDPCQRLILERGYEALHDALTYYIYGAYLRLYKTHTNIANDFWEA